MLSVAHPITNAIDESLSRMLTKVALMPSLAVWSRMQGGPLA